MMCNLITRSGNLPKRFMLGSWLMTFLCFGVMVQAQQQTPASSVSSSSAVASPVVDPVIADPEPNALFNAIEARAKSLAQDDFKPIEANIPDELANMNYDQYRSIHFRPEASLWRGESLFEIQLFHPGFLYREPVVLHMASSVGDPSLKVQTGLF